MSHAVEKPDKILLMFSLLMKKKVSLINGNKRISVYRKQHSVGKYSILSLHSSVVHRNQRNHQQLPSVQSSNVITILQKRHCPLNLMKRVFHIHLFHQQRQTSFTIARKDSLQFSIIDNKIRRLYVNTRCCNGQKNHKNDYAIDFQSITMRND